MAHWDSQLYQELMSAATALDNSGTINDSLTSESDDSDEEYEPESIQSFGTTCNEVSGYDLYWVEDPPDDLKCPICLCVARNPQQHPGDDENECGKIFCLECITKIPKNRAKCPNCRKKLTLFKDSKSAKAIKALKVKCDNTANGCNWTEELRNLETHLQSCDYAFVPCTNQCTTNGEITTVLKQNLQSHLDDDCPRRQKMCPHCKKTGEYQEITTTHLEICPMVRVHCPNTDCGEKIARRDVPTHQKTCAYEPVSCKYSAVGCKEKPFRKELSEHEKDSQLHLRVTTEKVLELTKINDQLVMTQRLVPYTVKVNNFQQYKTSKKKFLSPLFYTAKNGYKMCLVVLPHVLRASETGLDAYVLLMHKKRFTGLVKIELLNQLQDKNHHKQEVIFTNNDKSSSFLFISHAALDYNASTNTRYLKDDTLVFRVSAEAPDHKPWLECDM